MSRRVRRQVSIAKHRQVGDRFVSRALVLVGLVIHHRYLELVLLCQSLHQGITLVDERLAIAVPVHHESGDPHRLRLVDLAGDSRRIVRRVADGDVRGMTEPRLVQGDDLGLSAAGLVLQRQRLARSGARAAVRQN